MAVWNLGFLGLLLSMLVTVQPAGAAGRHASMVIDANTGQVLHAQGADEPRYPASLTKMMTLYIVFELMEQGRLQPTTRIRISDEAAGTQPSKLGLAPDSEIALLDAVKAIVTKSANDIAVAVAEHIAGTEPKFAQLMTRKAHQLGMTATTFRNAHGLPDSGQVTTARDMLTLAMRLSDDFPRYYPLFALRSFSYQGRTYANHNTMLGSYAGMDGLKTGYTTPSGFNLVASVHRNGRHVVAAVFGGTTASARNVYMRAILDRSLPKASTEKTRTSTVVARAKRPEPQPQPQPQPQQVAFRTTSEDAPTPALVEPVRQFDRAKTSEPATTPLQIARVRPVIVAPRPKVRLVETASADQVQAYPQASQPGQSETASGSRMPFPAPSKTSPSPVIRGNAPSSLQAQALNIDRGTPPVATDARPPALLSASAGAAPSGLRLKAPSAAPRPAAGGGLVALQIGAYASEGEAQRQLGIAREKAATALTAATPATQVVQTGGRNLYRARFIGLDPQIAASACIELRRAQIDCLVSPMR